MPAVRPDVALFHAAKADVHGNVWLGLRRETMLMAHASAATYVTAEEVVEDDLVANPLTAPGTLPGLYVTGIAPAKNGAWPLGVPYVYERDDAHLAKYAEMAKTKEGFNTYIDEWVVSSVAAE